jgi:DNA polymerase-4
MERPRRWIAHLDMDAFYASVELLRYPELRGLPVVIGGGRRHQPEVRADGTRAFATLRDYVGRGVITTATYPARARGVHSGIGLMKAARLAPDAILLPNDFEAYRRMSRAFKASVLEIAPVMEDRGIDEVYLDLSDLPGAQDAVGHDPCGGVRAIAQEIRNNVRRATGLTCSIGLTPNKLLSKLASEMNKPDGLTLLTRDDIPTRVWPLPARSINGVGPKAAAKLKGLGIETIGDIAAKDRGWLIEHFGRSYGSWLAEASNGIDERPVATRTEPVTMSRETTFERDLHAVYDRRDLRRIIDELARALSQDLRRKGYEARTIGIKLRFDDFTIVTRDLTLDHSTGDVATILRAAARCLERVDLGRRLRLLGVRASKLVKPAQEPPADAHGPEARSPTIPPA